MKTGPDRRYTPEFRDSAVKQVMEGGRTVAGVARSLEMSGKSLANWCIAPARARRWSSGRRRSRCPSSRPS